MTVSDSVVDVSSSSATDGEIILTTQNGVGNVIHIWDPSLGLDSNFYQTNLSAGTYNVEIQDQRGCYTSHTITVGVNTSISQAEKLHLFNIVHEYNDNFIYIKSLQLVNKPIQLSLFDLEGRLIKKWPETRLQIIPLDMSLFQTGQYILHIKMGDQQHSQIVTSF